MASNSFYIFLCLLVVLFLVCAVNDAHAKRDDGVGADHNLSQRDGLGDKQLDKSKMPGALEYAIVIGSVIATIGVVKFA